MVTRVAIAGIAVSDAAKKVAHKQVINWVFALSNLN